MINFQKINELVKKDVTEKSIMLSFSIDLNNVAPFMCSPFVEDWIWSENTKDLINYIFEILIPTYLVNSLIASGDDEELEEKDYEFKEAIEIYRKAHNDSLNSINSLKAMYAKFFDKEIQYLDFIKMTIKLEEVLEKLSVDFKSRSYVNPYEARYSSMLKTDKFDFKNLNNNF